MIIVIEAIEFPDAHTFPMVADVHYSLKGSVADLRGNMRIEVPNDFLEKVKKDITELLKERINQLP